MRKKYGITVVIFCLAVQLYAREYHVALTGSDVNVGTLSAPLRTIHAAAQKALPGDTVTVHAGTYREWVNPLYGGESDDRRILYRAAEGEHVELKGSELIRGWSKEKKVPGVWKVMIPNRFFGSYNPYADKIFGDWFSPLGGVHHTGEVYLNDVSLYEVKGKEKVFSPDTIRSLRDPQGSQRVWCAVVDGQNTTIYANFGKADPNRETVEIAVRPTCFYPTREGLNYITIRGFRVSQAATQWAAPTAEQVGMIATHWCKGWIIEDNIIKNSRCNGISLGKERATGHNLASTDARLDGTAHYIEVVFNTIRHGWNREQVGSHIVRNNMISDCEQTAICGSMGGAFSEIYGNHIYNIWVKRQFTGAEMAGIKLHGAIDTYIHHNRIHDCGSYGIWLDWMAQGARVSSNLIYRVDWEDLFFEVDHGPYMVDNNLLLSTRSLREYSDGGAYVNNLFMGNIHRSDEGRYTPYHLNHATEVKGISTITNGDHRFFNNIFIGGKQEKVLYGLGVYASVRWPIWAEDNVFYQGAKPVAGRNQGTVQEDFCPQLTLEEREDGVWLTWKPDKSYLGRPVTAARLGKARLTGYPYQMADGTPLNIDQDYFGYERSESSPVAGPFEKFPAGGQAVKVW